MICLLDTLHDLGDPAAALAHDRRVALGAQAGPAAVRQLAEAAGFSRFRQVTQTPLSG